MGGSASKTHAKGSAKNSKAQDEPEIIFRNLKVANLMDSDTKTLAAFKRLLKKNAPIILEYFNCMESIAKRRKTCESCVKMGDSKEKIAEFLLNSAGEIISAYGDLPFEINGRFTDLVSATQTTSLIALNEGGGIEIFDTYAEKCKEHVQFFLNYRA